MDDKTKKPVLNEVSLKGICAFLLSSFFSCILEKFWDLVWLAYVPVVIVVLYIIWAFLGIYSHKSESTLKLDKTELLFYNILIPASLTILIGVMCVAIVGDSQKGLFDNVSKWLVQSNNYLVLCIVFLIFALLCYFIVLEKEKQKACENDKTECRFSDESVEKLEEISSGMEIMQRSLEQRSQVGYTATCIPIKYNKEHSTFVFVLIKNLSHTESQWMFPGSHVEVSDNQLREEFDLTDINIVPGKIIQDKVKKEAGLVDLQLIDPNYETVGFDNTVDGKEQRSYPNTCYPAKTPVFNYLFRVSKSAKCYQNQNHRCHYDFTYIGEYTRIQEGEAEYEVVEVEFSKNKDFKSMERSEAIAYILAKLTDQINSKINKNAKKKPPLTFPFDQLCLDSIPEMIYNAILFYIEYKKL